MSKGSRAEAERILNNMADEAAVLIMVMPGIDCDVVQTELKLINQAVSNLLAEAEHHG